jgi:hypothetical protein
MPAVFVEDQSYPVPVLVLGMFVRSRMPVVNAEEQPVHPAAVAVVLVMFVTPRMPAVFAVGTVLHVAPR